MLTRRQFIKAGVLGGLTLSVLGGGYAWLKRNEAGSAPASIFDRSAQAIISALAPAFLAGALPDDMQQRQAALDGILQDVGTAIAGLSAAQQKELGELFALLSFAPARWLVAGVRSPWAGARLDEAEGFLRHWRNSRFALLQSAYAALHDLILGSWYARPDSWAMIAYPGPPRLS
jgi:hypothetical protein